MGDLTRELTGTYTRRMDGRRLSYSARLDGTHYQLRVWPAALAPADIEALPVAYQGDLVGEEGAADPGLVRRAIESFLEDWRPDHAR